MGEGEPGGVKGEIRGAPEPPVRLAGKFMGKSMSPDAAGAGFVLFSVAEPVSRIAMRSLSGMSSVPAKHFEECKAKTASRTKQARPNSRSGTWPFTHCMALSVKALGF